MKALGLEGWTEGLAEGNWEGIWEASLCLLPHSSRGPGGKDGVTHGEAGAPSRERGVDCFEQPTRQAQAPSGRAGGAFIHLLHYHSVRACILGTGDKVPALTEQKF